MNIQLFGKFHDRYSRSSNRSKEASKNIVISFFAKAISIACSLLIVPITINYVNPTQYGIWLTLSSIIGWISFFDLGLGNGFRNRFAEAKANGDMVLARQYVSTTYISVAILMLLLYFIIGAVNIFVNWPSVLNVDQSYLSELRSVFAVVSLFFCLNMIVRIFTTLLTADQKPGIASMISALGQLLSIIVIWLLTLFTKGSLLNLAVYYSGIPTMLLVVCSLYAFKFSKYRNLCPSIKTFKPQLISRIMNLGIQFFVIYVCMILVFQLINIIISRELGPYAVTEYNIAYKYFNVMSSLIIIIVTPFWSAFTDAYQKNEFVWMFKAKKSLEIIWLGSVSCVILMLLLAQPFYRLWVGDSIEIGVPISVGMAIYFSLYNLGNIYMYLINGIGTVRIQLTIYILFAVIAWPCIVFSCRTIGLEGAVLIPSVVMLIQSLFGKIQIEKIINQSATGIWKK